MRVQLGQIPKGREGTIATVAEMFRLIKMGQVDPEIITFTANAIGRTSFKREKKLVSKATKAVLRRVQILEDPVRHEFIQEPAITLQTGRGDCDDLVVLVASVLERMGFEAELVVGSQTSGGSTDFTHVWMRVFLPRAQQWLSVDPRGMLEFGWPVGRELKNLTALERFRFNEDTGEILMGRSGLSAPRFITKPQRRQRRQRIGLIISTPAPPPDFAPIGPVEGPALAPPGFQGRRTRGIISIPRSVLQMQRRMEQGLRGPQFPFVEERGTITGDAEAAATSGVTVSAGVGDVGDVTTQIVQEAEQKKQAKAERRSTIIQWLTIGALGITIAKGIKG